MKSYTDIEQSKVLAKILPLESADMCWEVVYASPKDDMIEYANKPIIGYIKHCLPAWSLAALLDILPTIDDEFEPQLHRYLDKYRCTYEGEEDSSGLWRVADNAVDACYELILKLHELKLL